MLQPCLKAPSWTPGCCVGSVILVDPTGQRRPQKEIKDRSVFESKYKEGTQLKNTAMSVKTGGRRFILHETFGWKLSYWSSSKLFYKKAEGVFCWVKGCRVGFCLLQKTFSCFRHKKICPGISFSSLKPEKSYKVPLREVSLALFSGWIDPWPSTSWA